MSISFYTGIGRTGGGGGGGGATIDTIARSEVRALTAQSGENVPAGGSVFFGGILYTNNTAGALTLPGTLNGANIIGAGFEQGAGGSATPSALEAQPSQVVPAGDVVFADGKLFVNNTGGDLTVPATVNEANVLGAGFEAYSSGAAIDAVPGASIPVGNTVYAGGQLWQNNTAAAITVPNPATAANMGTAGFENPAGSSEIDATSGDTIAPGGTVYAAGQLWTNGTGGNLTVPGTLDAASMATAGFSDALDNGQPILESPDVPTVNRWFQPTDAQSVAAPAVVANSYFGVTVPAGFTATLTGLAGGALTLSEGPHSFVEVAGAWQKQPSGAATIVSYAALTDLPDPTTVNSGVMVNVVNDPTPANNGQYTAIGSAPGSPATSWLQS